MRWERGIAVLIACLGLVLIVRVAWIKDPAPLDAPAVIQQGRPFYPVYFASDDGEILLPEFHEGTKDIQQLAAILLNGPTKSALVEVVPSGTELLSYTVQNGIVYLNFSHHLVTNHPGGSRAELLTVYGIVNTFVGVDGAQQVQIMVENETVDTLAGHVLINQPLQKDYVLLGALIA